MKAKHTLTDNEDTLEHRARERTSSLFDDSRCADSTSQITWCQTQHERFLKASLCMACATAMLLRASQAHGHAFKKTRQSSALTASHAAPRARE
eukprot:544593-Pleurochrysis_carterae.AAC.1